QPSGSTRQDSKSVPAVVDVPASVEGASPTNSEPAIHLPPGVEIKFENVTDRAGIRFRHFDGRTEKEYIMETMGSGLAWLDYDHDGWMDLFLVQGAPLVTSVAGGGPPDANAP